MGYKGSRIYFPRNNSPKNVRCTVDGERFEVSVVTRNKELITNETAVKQRGFVNFLVGLLLDLFGI